jgi:hypothetical protein
MSVSCECCVLSGRGLCIRLITHPEESYRVCLIIRRPWATRGCCAMGEGGGGGSCEVGNKKNGIGLNFQICVTNIC